MLDDERETLASVLYASENPPYSELHRMERARWQILAGYALSAGFHSHEAFKENKDRADSLFVERNALQRMVGLVDFDLTLARAEVSRLRSVLERIGEYTGEGPSTTHWQAIVKDLGQLAREALKEKAWAT